MREPYGKWLWDERRSILGWSIAVAGVGAMYAAFWPTFDDPDMQELLENYPETLLEALNYTDISTAAGYLSATVYGLVVGVLMAVYAIGAGTRLVAGDEEAHTLELVLAHPIGRRPLVLRRFAALMTAAVVIAVSLLALLLLISRPAQLDDIPIGNFAAMTLHLVGFAWVFGAVAFAAGAASGRRAVAISAGAAVAVAGFAANGVLPQVEGLEWTKEYSPFFWLNGGEPLKDGVQWGHVLVMWGLTAALVAAGTVAFARRDLAS